MTKYTKIRVLEEFEWIRQRPTIYLGSTELVNQEFYFIDEGKFKTVAFVPALHKLFEEILENSVDEYIRTKGEYANKIDVNVNPNGTVTIEDNGRGLEIAKHHQFPDLYIPEVIFTKLRSGSNFDGIRDGIGVNGLGAVLTVLFSETFSLITSSHGTKYSQTYDDMLNYIYKPHISTAPKSAHYTAITFFPAFDFFKADNWNMELLRKRVVDLAFCFPGIKFTFNNVRITSKKFKDIAENYDNDNVYEEGKSGKVLVCANQEGELKHHSYVNGANTYLGGPHIDYLVNSIINELRPKIEKKTKLSLKPADIKNHLAIFTQINIDNPIFSSQTKEKIINPAEEIKAVFDDILTPKFYRKILNNDNIINKIVEEARAKEKLKELQTVKSKQKQITKKKVLKLLESNSKIREKCILFITEGDSAAASAGLIRDPNIHAFLPLRGKVLNTYDMAPSEVLHNEEIQSLLNATGLVIGEEPYNLRYGKIVILSDEDPDGDSIKGLLLTFFFKYWKSLFTQNKICFLKTPLYIAEKGSEKIYIYDKAHLESLGSKIKGYKLTYFKGLGGLEKEDWNYFLNTNPRYVNITSIDGAKDSLKLAFSDNADNRKKWLMG